MREMSCETAQKEFDSVFDDVVLRRQKVLLKCAEQGDCVMIPECEFDRIIEAISTSLEGVREV